MLWYAVACGPQAGALRRCLQAVLARPGGRRAACAQQCVGTSLLLLGGVKASFGLQLARPMRLLAQAQSAALHAARLRCCLPQQLKAALRPLLPFVFPPETTY